MQCIRFIVLTLAGLVAAPVSAANLITNGTFDAPDIAGVFVTYNGTDDIDGWKIAADGTPFLSATKGFLGVDIVQSWQGIGTTTNPDGRIQSVDIDGLSTLSQSFATMPGATYRLSFDYSHNSSAGAASRSAAVTVTGSNPVLSETVTHALANSLNDMKWLSYSENFVADSLMATLMFAGTVNGTDLDRARGFALDNVAVEFISGPNAVIPLPATLPLAVGAFAAFGLLRRRR